MSKNNIIEAEFVRTFVIKERQERALFELASHNKRGQFFNKLCHDFEQILDDRFMTTVKEPIFNELKSYGAPKNCYVMSWGELDGRTLPLFDALDEIIGFGFPSLVLCIPRKLAYFEAEQEKGPSPRFLLRKD